MKRTNHFYLFFTMVCAVALPLLAQTITLGSTTVPRESCVVFIFVGTSNMAGRDKVNMDTVTSSLLWNYELDSQPLMYVWVPAKDPVHVELPPYSEYGCGPGVPFLKALSSVYPGYHFGILESCNSHWMISANMRRGKPDYDTIMNAAMGFQGNVRFGGIVAMFGWVEAEQSLALAEDFGNQAKAMAAEMREDLNLPDLPFLIGEFENGASSTSAVYRETVASIILTLPDSISNCAIVSSAGMTYVDDHHYDCPSQHIWGQRAFDTLIAHNWGPDSLVLSVKNQGPKYRRKKIPAITPADRFEISSVCGRMIARNIPPMALRNLRALNVPNGCYIVRQFRDSRPLAAQRISIFH